MVPSKFLSRAVWHVWESNREMMWDGDFTDIGGKKSLRATMFICLQQK